jgi:hypothetical protein
VKEHLCEKVTSRKKDSVGGVLLPVTSYFASEKKKTRNMK